MKAYFLERRREQKQEKERRGGAVRILTAAGIILALTACGAQESARGREPGAAKDAGASSDGRADGESLNKGLNGQKEASEPAGGNTDGAGETEAEEGTQSVKGRQFVDGFGLLEEGSPAVWQLKTEPGGEFPFTESELGRAELIAAAQQDGTVWLTVCVTDRSAEAAAEEEAEERAETDGAWFSIEENGDSFYVYSPLIARMNEAAGEGGGQNKLSMEGEALERAQFSPYAEAYSMGSPVRLPSGGFAFFLSCRLESRNGNIGEPEGEYRVRIAGFDEPISFELAAAPVFSEGEEPEGMFYEDGWGFLARGRQFGNLLAVETYTVPAEGSELSPGEIELRCYPKGEAEGAFVLCEPMRMITPEKSGAPAKGSLGGVQGRIDWFRIPDTASGNKEEDKARGESAANSTGNSMEQGQDKPCFTAVFSKNRIMTSEESGRIELPVTAPGETAALAQTVRFAGADIRLIEAAAENTGEGEAAGGTEMKEASGASEQETGITLHIRTEIENASPEMPLEFVLLEKREGEEENPYAWRAWPEFGNGAQEPMTGFAVSCREGETAVEVVIKSPSYIWQREIEVPVAAEPDVQAGENADTAHPGGRAS